MTEVPQINEIVVRENGCVLRDALSDATRDFREVGIPSPHVDAELLAAYVLGETRGRVHALSISGALLGTTLRAAFDDVVARRTDREPLQHITGRAAFRSLTVAVGPGVFVPRPETEVVAQRAIDRVRADSAPEPIAIDLGTGSGAIALAIATEVSNARVFAAEDSVDAFVWAERNVREVGATNVTLDLVDLGLAFPDHDGQAAVVVSNPPYIPSSAVPRDPEVRFFDPPHALFGGHDGLDVVRLVSQSAWRLLRPSGTVVVEHGEQQGASIRDLLTTDGWGNTVTHEDLTGRDRVTTATKEAPPHDLPFMCRAV